MDYTCIYCKQKKNETEFNREHVVPRMMGTYIDGWVLSDHQVCQQCNSFFSKEIEDKIAMNSYEAFLRMKSGTKKMTDGRTIGKSRLSLKGADGVFKGLEFNAVADSSRPERIHFDIVPCVGFQIGPEEYEYAKLEDIQMATEERLDELRKQPVPIIHFGYEKEQVETVLREKGYLTNDYKYSNQELATAFQRKDFTTSIKFSIDSYIRRVCSKTVFNFMCKKHSAEYMLDPKFDLLRDYIRNGKWDEALWFRYSTGFVSAAVPPNETAHMVGTMVFNNNGHWELLGCVTWFGEITYIMKVCDLGSVEVHDVGNGLKAVIVPAIDTHVAYFDNENQKIIEENVTLIYGGR